jgi:hypothetical protein
MPLVPSEAQSSVDARLDCASVAEAVSARLKDFQTEDAQEDSAPGFRRNVYGMSASVRIALCLLSAEVPSIVHYES